MQTLSILGACLYAYTFAMIKRTTMNIDLDLVACAKSVLGTEETTETVHAALREVVRQARLRRLVARRFDDCGGEDWLDRPVGEVRAAPVGAR